MHDFLKFYNFVVHKSYSSNWHLSIEHNKNVDMELAFAKAHVSLKKWLSENEGGY